MKPLLVDTIVRYRGEVYFVDKVVSEGDDPIYELRRTATPSFSQPRPIAAHSELTVTGGVLLPYVSPKTLREYREQRREKPS